MQMSSVASDPVLNGLVFLGENGWLSIEVDDYERLGSLDYHDANWLTASISVTVGSFSGTFAASIGTYELVDLHRQLRQSLEVLSGCVSFQNLENDFALKVEFLDRGKARISGVASPHSQLSSKLTFSFESDQSYLAKTLEQLSGVVRRFPIKK